MEDLSLSLYDVSARLGVSPSATKKRVANLNIPVQRGARGKMIFDAQAFALLSQADELLKAGHDFETCRRQLGLGQVEAPIVEAPEVEAAVEDVPAAEPPAAEEPTVEEPETLTHVVPEAEAPAPVEVPAPEPRVTPGMRTLPTPVMIQLGRRKAEAAQAAQPTGVQTADPQEREILTRLDKALKLMEEKEKQNQTLQAKLLVAYDEVTKLSATAAAFQERSLNLQLEVSKLQGELRLLTAPEENRPWWKFWG